MPETTQLITTDIANIDPTQPLDYSKYDGITDMIDAASNHKYAIGYNHNNPARQSDEALAEMFAAEMQGDQAELDFIKNNFGDVYDRYEDLRDYMIEGKKMSKLNIIAAIMLSVLVTGCSGSEYEDTKRGEEVNSSVYEFQELMDKDQAGDKESVFWDGKKAYTDVDESDDAEAGGIENGYTELAKELWKCNIYGLENYEKVFDTDDHVFYKGNDWVFEVKLVDTFTQEEENLSNNSNLKLIENNEFSEGVTHWSLYRGIKTVDNKNYAGYVINYRDGFTHSYEISFMMIGNMRYCEAYKNQILYQFDVNFNIDEWFEKNPNLSQEELLNE